MHDLTMMFADEDAPQARLALLLEHFSELSDDREPARIMYPLAEVLLLVTCATIASCDDFDDIVAWGENHLDFLRRFSEFHFGIPCERWLRSLVNRIDPGLFGRCFHDWIAELWPGRHDLIAIDGKTARRTHDPRKGLKALHTLSAYATNARLTLAQLSVPEKTNEITAIPDLLDELAAAGQLEGALVTTDAMGCQVDIADKIVAHKADYLLALKGNQPTLEGDVERYFADAPASEFATKTTVEKATAASRRRPSGGGGLVLLAVAPCRCRPELNPGTLGMQVLLAWRVADQLPAELGLLDLVIIDEASQSDVTELPGMTSRLFKQSL